MTSRLRNATHRSLRLPRRHKSVAQLSLSSVPHARSHRALSHAVHARATMCSAPRWSPASSSTSARACDRANNSSPNLSHTALLKPGDTPLLVDAAALLTPLLPEFGALLFGERLGWSLKEMWVNVLDTGGRQAMHNHANSFISGVVYLTHTHPDARTVFMKSPGGTDFSFKNDHAGVDHRALQRGQVDQPRARARRRGAVPELPDARRADQSRRAAHHAGVQRHSDAPRFLGLPHFVQRLNDAACVLWASLLMAASGFAGLGYQIVWTQQSALWLGHETAAVLAVVAAFFGGLAVGALSLGARIDRSARPARWYAALRSGHRPVESRAAVRRWRRCRAGCSGSSGAQTLCADALDRGVPRHVLAVAAGHRGDGRDAAGDGTRGQRAARGKHAHRDAVRSQYVRRRARRAGRGVRAGAAVRAFAHRRRCASRSTFSAPCSRSSCLRPARPLPPTRRGEQLAIAASVVLAATGLLGIGYEVLVVRVLSQVAENTVYTFAILLAVYLVGTALGAAGLQPLGEDVRTRRTRATGCCNGWRRRCLVGRCLPRVRGASSRAALLHAIGPQHGGRAGRRSRAGRARRSCCPR